MARVLVTRPAADAERTATMLRALGHEAVLSPVLDVCTLSVEVPRHVWQAALFTSRNAAIRCSPEAIGRETPCLAVGAATAEAVSARGFSQVVAAEGDANALLRMALDRLRPGGGPLLHPCGVHRAGRLVESLEAAGFEVVLAPCYETVPIPLTDRARTMLVTKKIDAALLYSARSARAFATAVEGFELDGVALLTLSAPIAEALPSTLRRLARWPTRPSEADLIACLGGSGDKS